MDVVAKPALPVGAPLRAPRRRPLLWLVLAMAVAAATLQSFVIPLDCDVSWLITVSEKLLAGGRLYVDVIEPNPPASVWLYLPQVWLAARLGPHPEAVVAGVFIAAAIVSLLATVRLAAGIRQPPRPLFLAAAIGFVTLVLPLGVFAQREHAALLLAFPALAAMALVADGRRLRLPTAVAAGAAAGLVVVLKPHFALAILPAAGFAAWRAGNLRSLVPAVAAGSIVAVAYVVSVLLFAPEYLRLAPLLVELYLPMRENSLTLLRGPVVIVPVALFALAAMLRAPRIPALPAVLGIGAAGFALAGLIQAKGYLNHALPAMALGMVALALLLREPGIDKGRRNFVAAAGVLLAVLQLYAMGSIRPIPGLAEAVMRVAPANPKVMTLGPDLRTGHPLVRHVRGSWVGSSPGLFIAAGAHRRLAEPLDPATRSRVRRYLQADLAAFAAEVGRKRPDILLVDTRASEAWLRDEPIIQDAIRPYRPAARLSEIEVWARR
jgi:hypothetical protein